MFNLCKLTTVNVVEKKTHKKNNFLVQTNKRYANLSKIKKFNKKKKVDKIHKVIVKELKPNINCHIKIGKNYNLLQM